MDAFLQVLGSVLVEVGKCFCGCIHQKIHTFVKFDSLIKALEQESTLLWNMKHRIEEEIESAVEQGKVKTNEAGLWLSEVENIKIQVTSLQAEITAKTEHLHGCCLNFSLRSRLSKQVVITLELVKLAREDGVFHTGVVKARGVYEVKSVEQLPGPNILDQSGAFVNLRKVMRLLKSDECGIIGIWGMGGVGKTTLIRNLNNQLGLSKEKKLFHVVIWVTVSKDLDMEKLQIQIADRLNLSKIVGESMERRDSQIFDRLSRNKFLLIFDDVWEKINLDKVGIPPPDVHIGCKIILTTRSREVCAEMKTDQDLKLDILGEEEAWKLFSDNAGQVIGLSHIKSTAQHVARECCGLPLAIITVGRAMRGKKMVELWRDALKQLQMSASAPSIKGLEKEVFLPLKWSYDLLEGKNIKPCFLYCSLYPEDFSIDVKELLQCLVADGLVDEHSLDESFNRGMALIENLKDSCLLECGNKEGTVRMHDVVRDVAIWISSSLEDGDRSLNQSGMGLYRIPEGKNLKSHKRVSFMNNQIRSLPDRLVECSGVTTLLLQGNPIGAVPEGFLQGFQALCLLNLNSTVIAALPHSLAQLGSLRALLLSRCSRLRNPWSLQGLRRLQMLDLSYCPIRNMPEGMNDMSSLRYLNISHTIFLETIPAGTFSGLSSLEVLDMSSSKYKPNINSNSSGGGATMDELFSLDHLAELNICVKQLEDVSDVIWMERLKKFNISIGHIPYQQPFPYSERIAVIGQSNLNNQITPWLLENASGLVLHDCTGDSGLWFRANGSSLSGLTSLAMDRMTWSRHKLKEFLPALEELYLKRIDAMEDLTAMKNIVGSNLRIINISYCRCVSLIPSGVFHQLQNLREIVASHCADMLDLVSDGLHEIALPNLRIVRIKNLENLRSVCTRATTWPCIEQIEVDACPSLTKLPLSIQHENVLKSIIGDFEWWEQLEMDDEDSKLRFSEYLQPPKQSGMAAPKAWKDTARPATLRW